jgi:hypothetical protein
MYLSPPEPYDRSCVRNPMLCSRVTSVCNTPSSDAPLVCVIKISMSPQVAAPRRYEPHVTPRKSLPHHRSRHQPLAAHCTTGVVVISILVHLNQLLEDDLFEQRHLCTRDSQLKVLHHHTFIMSVGVESLDTAQVGAYLIEPKANLLLACQVIGVVAQVVQCPMTSSKPLFTCMWSSSYIRERESVCVCVCVGSIDHSLYTNYQAPYPRSWRII